MCNAMSAIFLRTSFSIFVLRITTHTDDTRNPIRIILYGHLNLAGQLSGPFRGSAFNHVAQALSHLRDRRFQVGMRLGRKLIKPQRNLPVGNNLDANFHQPTTGTR